MKDLLGNSLSGTGFSPIIDIERRNRQSFYIFLSLIPIIPIAVNIYAEYFIRAAIWGSLTSFSLICMLLKETELSKLWYSIYGYLVFPLITILACFTHGTFTDPRIIPAFIALAVMQLLYMGISKAKFVLIFNIILLFILVILDYTGLLTGLKLRADQSESGVKGLSMMPYIFSIFGLWLMAKNFEKSTKLLAAELKNSHESTLRESSFLSRMSHEIRNPLNGMLGLIEAAKDDAIPPAARENLWLAEQTGEHLVQVLNEVLDFKKLQSQDYKIDPVPFNTEEISRTLGAVFKNLANSKQITLQSISDFNKLPHYVMADKKRMTQVVTNILSNAIKFTPPYGKITIESQYDHAAGIWSIEVSDTGPGMSAKTISSLFKPFSQGDISAEMSSQGAGLGLMIARQLAEQMGGDLTARSELGRGSTFRFSFLAPIVQEPIVQEPIVQEPTEARAAQVSTSRVPAASADKTDLTNRHILCVDDLEANLRVMSRPLEKAGATVYATMDPQIALIIAADTALDLVLTDISMPEMSGKELLQEIRKLKPELPVLAITGHVLEEDKARFVADGFTDIVCKPVSSSRLREIVGFNLVS